jgi:hypothetical protein
MARLPCGEGRLGRHLMAQGTARHGTMQPRSASGALSGQSRGMRAAREGVQAAGEEFREERSLCIDEVRRPCSHPITWGGQMPRHW